MPYYAAIPQYHISKPCKVCKECYPFIVRGQVAVPRLLAKKQSSGEQQPQLQAS